MLSKKWGREHRGLAIFDLSTGMVIPYVLAVSCVVIASAYMFHGQPYDGLLVEENGQVRVVEDSAGAKDFTKLISKRKGAAPELSDLQVGQAETRLAAMLVPRSTANFANSLSALSGEGSVSQFIFGLGVLAMALSTISILCLISGFVFCEALGASHGGKCAQSWHSHRFVRCVLAGLLGRWIQGLLGGGYFHIWVCAFPHRLPGFLFDDEFIPPIKRRSTQGWAAPGVECPAWYLPADHGTGSWSHRHHQDSAQ